MMVPPLPRATMSGMKARVSVTIASQFTRTDSASRPSSTSQKRP